MKNIFYSTLLLFITLPASEFILHYTSTENVNDYAGNGVTATTVKSENPKNAYCLDATGEAFTNGPCTNVTVTVTTPVICAGSNDTLMASGATTYTWSPSTALNTTTGAKVIANPTATTIYTVTGTYGGCITTAADTVTVNPLPTDTISISSLICPGSMITLKVSGNATSYVWFINGTIDSPLNTGLDPTFPTTYTVKGSFADTVSGMIYVCSDTQSVAVNFRIPQSASLCYTTVDTESTHNIIIWNNVELTYVDSVKVYFYNASNQWQLLSELPFGVTDYYIDTASINNPNSNTVRYALTIVDSCGGEENINESKWQNTLFIVSNGSGTFSWSGTGYLIEDNSSPVTTYVLYRDDLGNGDWEAIDSVSDTQSQMTDPDYSNYPNGKWYVAARLNVTGCPDVVRSAGNATAYSNWSSGSAGINQLSLSYSIDVYPNPNSGQFTIKLNYSQNGYTVEIYNMVGEKIYQSVLSNSQNIINLSSQPAGMYFVHLKSEEGVEVGKVLITK